MSEAVSAGSAASAPADAALADVLRAGRATIVDLRDAEPFGRAHLAGSVHIKVKSPDFVARVLRFTPADRPIVLVAESQADADWAVAALGGQRVVAGRIGGLEALAELGLPEAELPALLPTQVSQALSEPDRIVLLDVREIDEWEQGFVPGAMHIPMNDVLAQVERLPRDIPMAITCAGGQRSSLIASLLMARGFRNLFNVTGGMKAWVAVGLPVSRG